MSTCYERQVVGIDLHRRHTVIVRMSPAGERLGTMTRIPSTPAALREEMAGAGVAPRVVLAAGGAGGHLRLVLGGGDAAGAGRGGASGAPAGGEERRAGRRGSG